MATAFKDIDMPEGKTPRFALRALTFIEQSVLDICIADVAAGRALRTNEEIAALIGADGVATVPGILKRLEDAGYIKREIYQRGRVVCIHACGNSQRPRSEQRAAVEKCTLPPPCTVPHWSTIKDRVPTVAIQTLRTFDEDAARWIDETARRLRRDARDLIAECVARGIREIQAEESEA